MMTRFAKTAALACAAYLFVAAPVFAKPYTVVPGDSPITVDIPGSWKVEEVKRGIQAATADEEVNMWLESYRPSQLQTILVEHNDYYKEQGVTITGEPEQTEKDFPTYLVKVSDYPATHESKPTVLRYISVVPKAETERSLILSYWATPEGDKEYVGEVDAIINSLRTAYDKR